MRVLVIVNERAGAGDAGLYQFVRVLGMAGCEVVLRFARDGVSVESLTDDAAEFDRLVAAGGDGTASAICYATRGTGVAILPYPAGTANLIAANLGLPKEPPALAEVLLSGNPVAFDLGEISSSDADGNVSRSGFALMAGAGYDATIMKGAAPLKPALGAASYLVSAVGNLAPTNALFTLELDGKMIQSPGIAVVIANFGRIQFDLAVSPGSDPRDGVLDVAVLRSKTAIGLLPAITTAVLDRSGEHRGSADGIDIHRASRIEVTAEPALHVQADGDVLSTRTPFTAQVLPSAMSLIVPAGSVYA